MSKYKLGWLPDLPDNRDYNWDDISSKLSNPPRPTASRYNLNTNYLSPIEDQGDIGSCTAHAALGIVEYLERRRYGRHVDASRLFLYKVTRNLMGMTGDTGAYLRDTIKALRLFGVPPETYAPYVTQNFDREPTPFQYSLGQNYKSIAYARLDQYNLSQSQILDRAKGCVFMGYPLMCGFTCFDSLYSPQAERGFIPFPKPSERAIGGHAVTIIGFDNDTKNFRIRNSWGKAWGQDGYGWLPYQYLLEGLMEDIWYISSQDWVDLEQFV